MRVSVVIPCLNGERYVAEAVESVLGQTYRDLELIVVDDGSTDSTRRICESFLDDGRVRLVQHEENRGIAAARNAGVAASRGEYVAFLDQDDLWLPEKLGAQVVALDGEHDSVALVFSDVLMLDEKGAYLGRAQRGHLPRGLNEMSRRGAFRAFFLHNFIPLISVLVRRSCLDEVGGFDETIRGGTDDYELCLRLLSRFAVRYMEPPLAIHRVHPENYSRDAERLLRDAPRTTERASLEHPELAGLVGRRRAMQHVRLARYHRDAGAFGRARRELVVAIGEDRRWFFPYLMYAMTLTGPLSNGVLGLRRRLRRWLARSERPASSCREEADDASSR